MVCVLPHSESPHPPFFPISMLSLDVYMPKRTELQPWDWLISYLC